MDCAVYARGCFPVRGSGCLTVLALQGSDKVFDGRAQIGSLTCIAQPSGVILSSPFPGLC